MIKADEFLWKIKVKNLKFNDKVGIFHSNFKENNKYKIEDMENAEDIIKILENYSSWNWKAKNILFLQRELLTFSK